MFETVTGSNCIVNIMKRNERMTIGTRNTMTYSGILRKKGFSSFFQYDILTEKREKVRIGQDMATLHTESASCDPCCVL